MKKLLIGLAGLAVLVFIALAYVWYKMGQPLYEPGMAKALLSEALASAPVAKSEDANYWQVDKDVKLYHYSEGAGQPVLVIHGGPGQPLAKAVPGLSQLGEKYTLVYYHQRGCGKSSRPLDRFSSSNYYQNMLSTNEMLGLATQLADIERIRRILGEERLLLMGHSFGGFLATLYAAEFPERIKGLVLVAPADLLVMPIKGGGLFEEMRALLPEELKKEYADYLQKYLDFSNIFSRSEAELAALNRGFAKYYAIAASARGFKLPTDADSDWSGGWMVQAMYLSMGLSHDYRQGLARIQAPVLVLHGGKDIQSEEVGRRYAELLPRASFKVVPDAGHFIFYDQPQEFASVVGSFLAQMK